MEWESHRKRAGNSQQSRDHAMVRGSLEGSTTSPARPFAAVQAQASSSSHSCARRAKTGSSEEREKSPKSNGFQPEVGKQAQTGESSAAQLPGHYRTSALDCAVWK